MSDVARIVRRFGPIGAALALLAWPASAPAGVVGVPGSAFFAKNASGKAITCSIKLDDAEWSRDFVVKDEGEISMRSTGAGSRLSVKCGAPMEAGVFVLKPGERYAFLSAQGGKVMLRHVDF